MTNAPESRRTHVIRLLGTNKAGDVLQDIWIDLERIDVAKSSAKTPQGFWQGVQRLLRWQDDPDADDFLEDGNMARHQDFVKVCSPDEVDINDPEEFVKVPIIKSMKSRGSDQNYQDRNLNDETVESRKVKVRRIVHYDTNIDAAAQAAFDADPTRKAYVVKGKDYTKLDGSDGNDTTKDDSQFVEHEIIEFFKPRSNERDQDAGQVNRNVQVSLKNQYLIDESDAPDGKVVGENGINPPYRLDPWQNIINVQLATFDEILVAHALATKESQVTKDGEVYEVGYGKVNTAASGLGKTVASVSNEIIFGKPRDDAACFIKIIYGDANIQRGVLDDMGNLIWSTVKSILESSGAVSVSFAGEAFFVSSNDQISDAFLYVSFDGLTWQKSPTATNPNNGEDGQKGNPEGNHVAYNPDSKVWCHTGWFTRAYQYDLIDIDDGRHHTTHAVSENFWSATTIDGLHWKPKYDTSNFYAGSAGPPTKTGNQGSPGRCIKSVAYGAGVFVVPSSWAIEYDYFNFGNELNVNQHVINRIDSCGFAISADGISWNNKQLPGAEWDPGVFAFDVHGSGANNRTALVGLDQGIVWAKTGGTDPTTKLPKGFFLIIGFEVSSKYGDGRDGIFHKKRWISPDGKNWKLAFSLSDPTMSDSTKRVTDDALSIHKKTNPDKVIKV